MWLMCISCGSYDYHTIYYLRCCCEQVVLIDVLGVASCQDYFLYK